jgi:hypothetical protein
MIVPRTRASHTSCASNSATVMPNFVQHDRCLRKSMMCPSQSLPTNVTIIQVDLVCPSETGRYRAR